MFWNGNHQLAKGMNQLATCMPGDRRNAVGADTASLYCQTSHSSPVTRLIVPESSMTASPAFRKGPTSARTSAGTCGGSTARFTPGDATTRLATDIPHTAYAASTRQTTA